MRLELLDAVSDAEPRLGRINEDLYGTTDGAAWVLDGATGIADRPVLPGPSDARWLVDIVDASLREQLDSARPLSDMMEEVARRVLAAFSHDALRPDAASMDMPCTCLALLRLIGDGLELANIGDCRILCRPRDGGVWCFGSSKLSTLDERLRVEVMRLQATGLRHEAVWPLILPLIRRNRGLMNDPEGYWILDASRRWIDHVERATTIATPGDVLLLVTDGFWRLVDLYGSHDAESLVAAAQGSGLRSLIAELRAIEASDEACLRHPRLKAQDDATAVLLRITEER